MKMNLSNVGHKFLVYDGVNLADHFIVSSVNMPLLPTIDASTIKIDGKPGEWFSKRMIGTRDVSVKLSILNDTRDRRDIMETWFMLSDVIAKDKIGKLEIGNGRYVNAMLVGDTETETNGRFSTVNVAFRCFDPYIYGEEHSATLKTGNNAITVMGKYPTYPTIEITGASTTTLTNSATGEKVRVEGLSSSQTLVINMAEYRCTVNGLYKSADLTVSDFWPIAPGGVTLNLSSGTGTLRYRELYL